MHQTPVPITAFAPLRWAALPAPSQRVIAQLAKTRSVFVLEAPEPIDDGEREFWELRSGAPDFLVCWPRVATPAAFAEPETKARVARALLHWLD